MVIWRLPLLVGLTLAVAVCSGTDPGPTAPVVPLQITTTSLPNGVQNADYGTQSLGATGGVGSYAWSVVSGALPAGLSLSSDGNITGMPTGSGTTNFMVEVTSGSQAERGALSITVNAALQVITTSLASGAKGEPFDQALAVSGGDGIYTWFVVLGALPPGLSLATNGALSGTPSSSGTFDFTVEVRSGDRQAAQRALSVSISDTAPIVLSPNDRCSAYPANARVTFADAGLAEEVGLALGVPPDSITCERAGSLTSFTVTRSRIRVDDLRGLQNLTGLTTLLLTPIGLVATDLWPIGDLTELRVLTLSGFGSGDPPAMVDLGPLASLRNLERLRIELYYRVDDLTPLAGLTGLDYLALSDLKASTDLGPLSELVGLETLVIFHTSVADIAALENLLGLKTLSLNETGPWSDLSPLANLDLEVLSVHSNPWVHDATPLVNNPHLGPGDYANLYNTSVSCTDIEALQAKGVTVQHNCLRIVTESIPTFALNTFASFPLLTSDNRPPATDLYSWSLVGGSLPPGLAFAASGEIVGTPTVAGSWEITVRVEDNNGPFSRSAERSYTLVVTVAEG